MVNKTNLNNIDDPKVIVYYFQNRKNSAKIWCASTVTSSGAANFYPTDDNTSAGNAVFTNIYSVHITSETNATLPQSNSLCCLKSISANKKTIVANVITGTLAALGLSTFSAAPDGTKTYITIIGD